MKSSMVRQTVTIVTLNNLYKLLLQDHFPKKLHFAVGNCAPPVLYTVTFADCEQSRHGAEFSNDNMASRGLSATPPRSITAVDNLRDVYTKILRSVHIAHLISRHPTSTELN